MKTILFQFFVKYLILLSCSSVFAQHKKPYRIRTIAFYNVENLFDTKNDSLTFDDQRTPLGKYRWTPDAYRQKIKHISQVISGIGAAITGSSPDIIGLAEIENRSVLDDLIHSLQLTPVEYGIVHFDSPDERGIDVALLYKKSVFTPIAFSKHPLLLFNSSGYRDYTRDQLLVFGMLDNEEFYFIVNHWPSRSGGATKSAYKRLVAAALTKQLIDSIQRDDPEARIIAMGDFNDNPDNRSFKQVLKTKGVNDSIAKTGLFNPMEAMYKKGIGTLAHRDQWGLFDQLFFTGNLLNSKRYTYRYWKAGIYVKPFMTIHSGPYKGYPFRSYEKGNYTAGYSDHFPVYLFLVKEILN